MPQTASRYEQYTYLKLIHRIRRQSYTPVFEGPLYRPGALIPSKELGENPVILECAGPVTTGWGHRRAEYLYILWRYEWYSDEWVEIGRAQAIDNSWVPALRELARAARRPRAPVEVFAESERIARKFMETLDSELEEKVEGVGMRSLNLIYERVAARIVHHCTNSYTEYSEN